MIDTTRARSTFRPVVVDGHVEAATFSTAGDRLAVTIGDEAALVVLDATTGIEVATAPGVEPANPDDVYVRAANLSDALYFAGPASGIITVGDVYVVGSIDGSVRLFDVETTALRATVTAPHNTVSLLHAAGDGTVVTAGRVGLTRVDLASETVLWQHAELEPCRNLTVVASRDMFYCGDPFGRLVERDLATGLPVRRLDAQDGNSGTLWPARDGTELVAFGINEPVVARWRLDGSGPITHLVAPGWDVDNGFSPAGDRMLVGRGISAEDAEKRVIDVDSGAVVASLDGMIDAYWVDDDTVTGVTLNADGLIQQAHFELAAGRTGMVLDETVFEAALEAELVSADEGKERSLLAHRDGGRHQIIAGDVSGPVGPRIVVDDLVSMSVSRTGHRVVAGTEHGVLVYDGFTGELVGEIPRPELQGVFVTLADQLFVSSLGGELTQYDLESMRPVRTFGGSRGYVQDLVGTSDGSLIAVRGGDRTVTLYDVATGVRLGAPIVVAEAQENLISLSPHGDRLAIGGGEGEAGVQIWNLDPAHWVAAACRLAGRNLTRDEWATNIGDLAPYRATCPAFPVDR